MKLGWLTLCLAIVMTCSAETNHVIRTAAELLNAVSHKGPAGHAFKLHATALSAPPERRSVFFVKDAKGHVPIYDIRKDNNPCIMPGDHILVSGILAPRHRMTPEDMLINANCTNVIVLKHGQPPRPIPITAEDMTRSDIFFHSVYTCGNLVNIRTDEIDPRFTMFAIDCNGHIINAVAYTTTIKDSMDSLKRLIGAKISIYGVLNQETGTRIHLGPCIYIQGTEAIHVLKPPSDDLFCAPEIGDTSGLSPEAIIALGRRRAVGKVLAAWNGDTLLLRTQSGELIKASLITPPPAIGDCIEVVGYVETDLFHINLASVIWRKIASTSPPNGPVLELKARDLLVDNSGNRKFNVTYHGSTVRLKGIVQDTTSDGRSRLRIILADEEYSIAIDCSNTPEIADGLEFGSTVCVTGVCIVETETWNKHSILPFTRGIFIVLRSPDDITILATPPWWTPAKLIAIIGVLVLLLVVILIWNASLRILSEQRGREIYHSQIARMNAELRTDERTRLAAELHDHLAQNLTAVSYQIAAADRSRMVDADASARHLDNASRMLGSCRTELRRCLWDLRNDALDETDVNQAIWKSIEPIVGNINVNVEVNASRSKLSDSSLHATLSIIRELTSNAVKHGHARNIKITGKLSHGRLHFSVIDDGCGFNTVNAPGLDEGHFGLDGVRERVRRHNGEMSVESTPGKGTRISIMIKLQQSDGSIRSTNPPSPTTPVQ